MTRTTERIYVPADRVSDVVERLRERLSGIKVGDPSREDVPHMIAALSGAAGLRIGAAVVFPGARSRLQAASDAGRTAGKVMVGVIIMLLAAGLLEGFGRQLITDTITRYAIGTVMLLFWLAYYYLPRRGEVA